MTSFNHPILLSLANTIYIESNFKPSSVADCKRLKHIIKLKTGHELSEIVIQRFFGYAPQKFFPSRYTLNILAEYCGFIDWNDFVIKIQY